MRGGLHGADFQAACFGEFFGADIGILGGFGNQRAFDVFQVVQIVFGAVERNCVVFGAKLLHGLHGGFQSGQIFGGDGVVAFGIVAVFAGLLAAVFVGVTLFVCGHVCIAQG